MTSFSIGSVCPASNDPSGWIVQRPVVPASYKIRATVVGDTGGLIAWTMQTSGPSDSNIPATTLSNDSSANDAMPGVASSRRYCVTTVLTRSVTVVAVGACGVDWPP